MSNTEYKTQRANELRQALATNFNDVFETSLSTLSDHDWAVLSSTEARGIDWCVSKLGRQWQITLPAFSGFPLYRTKTAAYDAVSTLMLREASYRAMKRLEAELAALEEEGY